MSLKAPPPPILNPLSANTAVDIHPQPPAAIKQHSSGVCCWRSYERLYSLLFPPILRPRRESQGKKPVRVHEPSSFCPSTCAALREPNKLKYYVNVCLCVWCVCVSARLTSWLHIIILFDGCPLLKGVLIAALLIKLMGS